MRSTSITPADGLPEAEIVLPQPHPRAGHHQERRGARLRAQGRRAVRGAMAAMVAAARRARPRPICAAPPAPPCCRGGDIDFLIIGSTRWRIRRCSRPSAALRAQAQDGDIVIMELAPAIAAIRADRLRRFCLGPDRDGAQILGGDHAPRLSQDHRRDKAGNPIDNIRIGRAVLFARRACSRADPDPRQSTSSRRRRMSSRSTRRAMHKVFLPGMVTMGAQPDHRGRECSASSSAHLHRHADGHEVVDNFRSSWRSPDARRPRSLRLRRNIPINISNRRSGGRNVMSRRVSPYLSRSLVAILAGIVVGGDNHLAQTRRLQRADAQDQRRRRGRAAHVVHTAPTSPRRLDLSPSTGS